MNVVILLIALTGFDQRKTQVRELIAGHLRAHPACESAAILPILDNAVIVSEFHINPNVSGWIHEGKIFINSNKKLKWTDRKIVLFLIHELIHICGHCLNDSFRAARPICTIFARRIYHSEDLTRAVRDHFPESKHNGLNHQTAHIKH